MPDWSLVLNLASLVSIFTVICNVIGRYQKNNRGMKQWFLCLVYAAFVIFAKLQFPKGYSDLLICLLSWFAVGYLDYFFGTKKYQKNEPLQNPLPVYEQPRYVQELPMDKREPDERVVNSVKDNLQSKKNRPGSSPGKGPTFQSRISPVDTPVELDETTRQSIYRRALGKNPLEGGEDSESDVY